MIATHLLVVAYDIFSDRRRNQLVKVLSGYGVWVNFSVFECLLHTTAIKELKEKIAGIAHRDDSVLFYELCRHCETKMDTLGWRVATIGGRGGSTIIL